LKKYWNRTTRNSLLILMGLLIGFGGYILNENKIENQVKTAEVIIAKVDIPPHTKITKDMLAITEKPLSEISEDTVKDASEITFDDAFSGQFGFLANAPIRTTNVTTAANSPFGSVLNLPKGMVEIGIKSDLILSTGSHVKPGTLVDAYAAVTDAQTNEVREVVDKDLKALLVKSVLNSEATEINQPEVSGSKVPAVIVVEVNPQQATKILNLQENGKVYLLPSGVK